MSDGVAALTREIDRLSSAVADKVSIREMDDVKRDVQVLENKLDKILHAQLSNQRTANLQLAGIIVTLVVAGFGALT